MDGNETFLCDEFEFLTNLKFNYKPKIIYKRKYNNSTKIFDRKTISYHKQTCSIASSSRESKELLLISHEFD